MKTSNHKCYPVFETNQILTSTHLNRMRDYLDEENRLTRNKLIGFGIVCGLKPQLKSKGLIVITKGSGVSTDGYLLSLDETTEYTRFKSYNFPTEDQIKIPTLKKSALPIEILQENTSVAGTSPLTNYENADLKNKVVVLYLEFKDEILQSCTGTNCDNKGKKKDCNIKVLLVNESDLTGESSFLEALTEKYDLPDLFIGRFKLIQEIKDVKKYDEAVDKIDNADVIVKSYKDIFTKNLIKQIAEALNTSYKIYQPFLQDEYTVSPFVNAAEQLAKILDDNSLDIQYRYDFLCELINAYNEFKVNAFNLVIACAPDIEHFPRHLLLGFVDHKEQCKPATYRYPFVQPPIYNSMAEKIKEVKHLLKRMVNMLANFYIPHVAKNGIKITPSKEKVSTLSNWSIPYYYFGKKEDSKINEVWNYEFYRRCRTDKILSYFSELYNKKDDSIKTPLEFNHDEYPFLRIEGIHGKKADEVLNELVRQSKIYHLPFNTVILNLEKDTDTININYDKAFYDLQEEYFFHRGKLHAIIKDVKKYYDKLIAHDEKLLKEIEKLYEKIEDDLKFKERIELIFDFLNRFLKLFPPCLKNFDYELFKTEYKKALISTVDFILIKQKLLENIFYEIKASKYGKEFALGNTLLNFFLKLLFKLIDNIYHTQLLRIYFGYRRREYFLLVNHLSIFSNFVNRHPGIEHLAGVYKGGTFILVCESNEVVADFSLPYLCCTEDYNISFCNNSDTLKNIMITPFARPDFVVTQKDKPVTIDVLDNDDGFYGDDVEFVKIIHKPKNGEVNPFEKKDEIIYTPAKGFTGVDTFTYFIRNIHNKLTDEGIITVIVLDEPLKAVDDSAETTSGKPVSIKVLSNDTYPADTKLQFVDTDKDTFVTSNKNRFVIKTDEKEQFLIFKSKDTFTGEDQCKYKIVSGNRSDEATVKVKVNMGEIVLEAADDSAETTINQPVVIRVMDNDTFPTGTELRFADTPEDIFITNLKNQFAIEQNDEGWYLLFTPTAAFTGEDSCKYRIVSGDRTADASVKVTVKSVEVALEAVDDKYDINCNTPQNLNVLENDKFDKEKSLELLFFGIDPKQGILGTSSVQMITTEKGADVFLVTGQSRTPFFKYVPYSPGSDKFEYQIKQGSLTANAAVTLNVSSASDSVVLVAGTISANGKTLYACNVLIKGTNIRTTSDDNGKYEIRSGSEMRSQTLIFFSENYGPKEVIVCNNTIDIDLSNYPGRGLSYVTLLSENNLNTIKTTDNYKRVITDAVVAANVNNTAGLIEYIKSGSNRITEDLKEGTVNNDFIDEFNKAVDPLIEEIQKYNEMAAAGDVTENDTLKNKLNLELFNVNVEAFLQTISTTETDIEKSGEIANYIAADLKERISIVNEMPEAKTKELINKIATANSDKPELASVVSALIR